MAVASCPAAADVKCASRDGRVRKRHLWDAGPKQSLRDVRACDRGRSRYNRRGALRGRRAPLAEQLVDRRCVWVARWAQFAPCAVGRLLVLAPADELRAVPEAIALHLVVAHFDDDLRAHRGLLEVARPPAVRLREAALVRLVEQRPHALLDLLAHLRADSARAD